MAGPRVVAVTGGKGGVGKSVVAANLALALGRGGQRVVLVDADLGAANLHAMLGLAQPRHGLGDFLAGALPRLDAARLPLPVPTVSLVAGTSRPGSANLGHGAKLRLLRALGELDCDCVVVDVGAGASFNVVDLVAIADQKLFVVNANLTSLHNAYALLKACAHRTLRRLTDDEAARGRLDAALASEGAARSIPELVAGLRAGAPVLADQVVGALHRFGVGLVGNALEGDHELAALRRMSSMIYDHLMVPAPVLGAIRRSAALAGDLIAGVGTVADRGDPTFASFRALARAVTDVELGRLRGDRGEPGAPDDPGAPARAVPGDPRRPGGPASRRA